MTSVPRRDRDRSRLPRNGVTCQQPSSFAQW